MNIFVPFVGDEGEVQQKQYLICYNLVNNHL